MDTIPPAETITSLAVNGNDDITLADQADLAITVTGQLSTALRTDESVVIVLPNGDTENVTPAAGATSFSFSPDGADAASFGAGGSISAYVTDLAGSVGPTTAQAFNAEAHRALKLVSADPTDPSQALGTEPALSADGSTVAFQVAQGGEDDLPVAADDPAGATADITAGIYVETLATGKVTLAQPGAENPALSGDGTILAYDAQDSSHIFQVYAENLTTGVVTLVSDVAGAGADANSYEPSISADGTKIAFLSYADDLVSGTGSASDGQLYVATLSGGTVSDIAAVSVAPDGTFGNGFTNQPELSGDGSEVTFSSTDTNLLAAGDPHSANLSDTVSQIYVRALIDNAESGLSAGQMVLVSGNPDGSVGNATSDAASLSANGRYVVFTSQATNLVPGNLPAGREQVYVKDLLTGAVSLVSQTAAGVVGDGSAANASISADGSTVVFSDNSDNLGADAAAEQIYAASLSNGAVTGLTLLSEPGAIPGDDDSSAAVLSADGATVAFQSMSDNLVAGSGSGENVYTTAITPAAPAPASLTVTNTNDSGAGSLRAALAAAHDGDTIVFAAAIAGGTITLDSSLTVAAGVTINGLDSDITVSGNGAVTVFDVAVTSGYTALIEGLTIADGAGSGAAGAGATDSSAAGQGAAAAGGVDLSAGVLRLVQDDFVGNVATGGSGGAGYDEFPTPSEEAMADGGTGGGAGGALVVGAGASLFGSSLSFSQNSATGGTGGQATAKATGGGGGAAGGAIYVDSGATVSLDGLTLDNNTAVGGVAGAAGGAGGVGGPAGGAVYVAGDATVSANGLSFSHDSATGGTGGAAGGARVELKGSGVGGDAAGAIYVDPATSLTPLNFTYDGDSAAIGIAGNGEVAGPGGYFGNGYFASAATDTNLGTASVAGPARGSTAEDGYIVGATVSYENGSGFPAGETATTDATGGFTLTYGTGPIMLTGGTDSATGLPFTGTLIAPAGSTVISPLTTLVEAVAEAAGAADPAGVAIADARVLAAFGLPAGLDLTSFNAEGALFDTSQSAAGAEAAADVFEADNYLESAGRLITAAGGSVPTTLASIAQQLAAGQTLDLTKPATLFADAGLSAAATSAAVDIANATISAVQTQLASAHAPGAAFVDISGASLATQGAAATALATAAQAGTDAAFQAAASNVTAALPQTLATDDAAVPCYVAGTRVATTGGEVAVEQLAVGDRVVLARGGDAPIVWLGHRTLDCRRHRRPREVWPVRIAAGAFGPGLPRRDVLVSPGHSVFVDGVLLQAHRLINGCTIVQEPCDQVTYWHVELARHDVMLAEGLACESYLDTGNRGAFINCGGAVDLHPDFSAKHWSETCVPLVQKGPILTAARERIIHQALAAGWHRRSEPQPVLWEDGRAVRPAGREGKRWRYPIRGGAAALRLRSRSAVPAEVLAGSQDRRRLGLWIDGVAIISRSGRRELDLVGPELTDGWHNLERSERGGWRWTDGDAGLAIGGPCDLEISVGSCLPSWEPPAIARNEPRSLTA